MRKLTTILFRIKWSWFITNKKDRVIFVLKVHSVRTLRPYTFIFFMWLETRKVWLKNEHTFIQLL